MLVLTLTTSTGDDRAIIETPEGRIIEAVLVAVRSGNAIRLGIQADRDVVVDRASVAASRRKSRPNSAAPIHVPKGIGLAAYEAGAIFDVQARDEHLYYPALRQPVPSSAEVIVEHEPGREHIAKTFADSLRAKGWANVVIESRQGGQHDIGEPVA